MVRIRPYLLLGVGQFVGSLHRWVEDGLRAPHLDLKQAHVDPEHGRTGQLHRLAAAVLDVLLQAGGRHGDEAFGELVGRQPVVESRLHLLGPRPPGRLPRSDPRRSRRSSPAAQGAAARTGPAAGCAAPRPADADPCSCNKATHRLAQHSPGGLPC